MIIVCQENVIKLVKIEIKITLDDVFIKRDHTSLHMMRMSTNK